MKRIFTRAALLLLALSITGCVSNAASDIPLGKVMDCSSVNVDPAITEGSFVQCLANTDVVAFEAIRGPAMINFWGSWCASCIDEMPYLREFYAENPNIKLIGIDVEEQNIEDGRGFVRTSGITWPNYFDYSSSTRKFSGLGVPVTLFIDAQGKVLYTQMGAFKNKGQIEALAKKYLS